MAENISFTRTKIVGTLGPSSDSPTILKDLIHQGLDVLRLNASHMKRGEIAENIHSIRKITAELRVDLAILVDLGGPKIRLGELKKPLAVKKGNRVTVLAGGEGEGEEKNHIPAGYQGMADDLQAGNSILIDDGSLELTVLSTHNNAILCEVCNDGILQSHKGLNLPGAKLKLPTLTEKDRQDIAEFSLLDVDYVALSFVRSASDVEMLRQLLKEEGRPHLPIIAKIEKPEAVACLEEILSVSDGIMVARGDLGVEMALEELPIIQKKIISAANQAGKIVITATQMLESMIVNPRPTRAEASDIANAVFDGTDAVMLSGETSVGAWPREAVKTMDKILRRAEQDMPPERLGQLRRRKSSPSQEDSVCYAACLMAEELHAKALITITKSGRSARLLSRYRSMVPILAFCRSPETVRRLALSRGVQAELIPQNGEGVTTLEDLLRLAIKLRYVKEGENVVGIAASPFWERGKVNMLQIETLE